MVLGFWVPAIGLFAAVALVLWRALQMPQAEADKAETADQRLYRDQLAEVERDIAKGILAPDEGARLRAEVARRLLEAARAGKVAPQRSRSTGPLPLALMLALLLASAGGYYFWLGAPFYPDLPLSLRLARAEEFYNARPTQEAAEARLAAPLNNPTDPAEAALVEQLRAAVAARPVDLRGHQLLAQSEAGLGNLAAARIALQRAIDLKGSAATPQDHAELAEMMIAAAGGEVSPQAEAELVITLRADPRNGVARYYSGLMLAQVGRPDQAFAMWRSLLEESGPDAAWYAPIRAQIADLAAAAGVDYALPEVKGPDAAAIAAAAEMSEADRAQMIEGMVAGLETRLLAEGGTAEDWVRLVGALRVLGDAPRLQAAVAAAETALANDPAGLDAVRAAGEAP